MWFRHRSFMCVLMMNIVHMAMLMHHHLVHMLVLVPLRQVQPNAGTHE